MVNISDPNEWKRLSKLEPTTYECEELHPSKNQNHRVLENEADPKTRDMAGYIKTMCVCVCVCVYVDHDIGLNRVSTLVSRILPDTTNTWPEVILALYQYQVYIYLTYTNFNTRFIPRQLSDELINFWQFFFFVCVE